MTIIAMLPEKKKKFLFTLVFTLFIVLRLSGVLLGMWDEAQYFITLYICGLVCLVNTQTCSCSVTFETESVNSAIIATTGLYHSNSI